jgi:hypothetical protein
MAAAFPFLAEMRILATQTPEPHQSVANPDAHEALLSPQTTAYFDLPRIAREGFETVLAALGADPAPSASVTDVVYAFSGGHLALASRCAARIAKGETDAFISAADSDEFLRRLLTERIRSLGALGKQAVALLQVAAVLGLSFRRDEVMCASGVDESQTSRLLRYCRDEDVLELTEGVGRFVHDLYRQYFLTAAQDKTGIHERLADCLRLLRPADYDLRCLNALDAERSSEAGALAIQAALQRVREGRSWQQLPPTIVDAIAASGMSDVLDRLVTALGHLRHYRVRSCINSLDSLPHDLPKCLLAEADNIRAMCLMSTRSEEDRANGRSILDRWAGYEDEEPELGVRLMQLLLYGLTHLRDKEPGRTLEGRVRQALVDRVSFDVAAQDALYTMDRCSASLYPPDVAVVRTREAAAYYAPGADQTVLRRPIEYYRCLVNYGANLISTAQYEAARQVYDDLEQFVHSYSEGVFPRLDFPRMNGLLAEYRLSLVDATEAVRRQQEIVDSFKVEGDPFYVENALAVYTTLADRHEEALEIFDRLYAELTASRRDPESSMVYLIRANRCIALFVSGEVEAAQAEWLALAEVVDRIAYTIRPLLVRRHELLAEVIGEGGPMSAREFDEYLVMRGPLEFGPLWENFGRGFRMPEIEFWRDN